MIRRLYRIVDLDDHPFGVDQVTDTLRMRGGGIIGGTVGDPRCSVGIAKQVVAEIELFLESPILFGGIETGPQNDGVFLLEVMGSITEPFAFQGSARGIGFRIPPQNDPFSRQSIQRDGPALLIRDRECRGSVARFEQWHDGNSSLYRFDDGRGSKGKDESLPPRPKKTLAS